MKTLILLLTAFVAAEASSLSPIHRSLPKPHPANRHAAKSHQIKRAVDVEGGQPRSRPRDTGPYHADLVWANMGASPAFSVQLGSETFPSTIFDLGSSVFWVPGYGWECVDSIDKNLTEVPRKQCAAEESVKTTSDNFTFSGGQIPGVAFNSTYNGGEQGVAGPLGYQAVTVGDLTVSDAVVGVATEMQVDFQEGGIMGFSFPYLTAEWTKSELEEVGNIQSLTNVSHYNPWVFQAAADGLIDPLFGYYFDDMGNPDGTVCGQVAFGGQPDIASECFSADVPVVPTTEWLNSSSVVFDNWNIHVDGFKIMPRPDAEPVVFSYLDDDESEMLVRGSTYLGHVAVIDTGTPTTVVPHEVYEALVQYIDPPPQRNPYGAIATSCNATIPGFAITIGGTDIWFNSSGIVFPPKYNPGEGSCELGVLSTTARIRPILGATFLINAVVVHEFSDLTAPTVKMAQRVWE